MAFTPQQLQTLADILARAETVRTAAQQIKADLAPVQALVMDDFDMRRETPVMQVSGRSAYLMSTDGHCWSVTSDPAHASAVVLTQA